MKRKIVVLLLSLCLLLGLSATASALDRVATLSEDLQQITSGSTVYVRFNASMLDGYYYEQSYAAVQLSQTQSETIEKVTLQKNEQCESVLRADISYKDGSKMQICYIEQSMMEEYMQLIWSESYIIDFQYPTGNCVDAQLSKLKGKQEVLFDDQLDYSDVYDIYSESENGLRIVRGKLLSGGDEYYYLDFQENSLSHDANIYGLSRPAAWLITDSQLCQQIAAAEEEYYGSDFGFLEDEDFSDQITQVFLIILFVMIPLAVLVLFLILSIKAKTKIYRTLFITVCVWSGLVLFVSAAVALVVHLG